MDRRHRCAGLTLLPSWRPGAALRWRDGLRFKLFCAAGSALWGSVRVLVAPPSRPAVVVGDGVVMLLVLLVHSVVGVPRLRADGRRRESLSVLLSGQPGIVCAPVTVPCVSER